MTLASTPFQSELEVTRDLDLKRYRINLEALQPLARAVLDHAGDLYSLMDGIAVEPHQKLPDDPFSIKPVYRGGAFSFIAGYEFIARLDSSTTIQFLKWSANKGNPPREVFVFRPHTSGNTAKTEILDYQGVKASGQVRRFGIGTIMLDKNNLCIGTGDDELSAHAAELEAIYGLIDQAFDLAQA